MAKIPVVEEEDVIRGWIRIILQNAGYEVVEAGNGDAAWLLMQRASVDAVIADCRGRVSERLALWKRIRAEGTTAQIPVIALCGLGQAGAEAGLRTNALVIKPFRPANRLMKVETVLRSHTWPVQSMIVAKAIVGTRC